ncbi:hypothetical protein RY972_14405 [Aeromonas allosaccharophila]|uniref:Uncharacterized protein n=1 Tax=Aeromonas allosaccharophila TaxID=656 RepID=A0ABZ0FHI7_9GAMM|nr:hypothetical protein [Aeromonas allosaccharophila]WOE68709.1 hypothetical protein RY972_14405 [Aeromonas allosaccharophila]
MTREQKAMRQKHIDCHFTRFGGTLSPISPQRLDPDRCRHLNKSQKKRAQPSHNAF